MARNQGSSPVELPWWDVEGGEWKVASLPARTLSIKGAAAPPPETEAGTSGPDEIAAEAALTETVGATPEEQIAVVTFWQRATEILAILWLLTLVAWWWSSRSRARKRREPREPKVQPLHKQQSALLKQARTAAAAGDEWASLQWPESAPRSIGEIANRVEAPLSDELRKLSAASYGPGAQDIDGAALAKALKSVNLVDTRDMAAAADALPPLMPQM